MLSTLDVPNPSTVVALLIGSFLLLKKLAEMERYHELRVLILTLIFSCIVLYVLASFVFAWVNPIFPDCVPPEHFCMTEM